MRRMRQRRSKTWELLYPLLISTRDRVFLSHISDFSVKENSWAGRTYSRQTNLLAILSKSSGVPPHSKTHATNIQINRGWPLAGHSVFLQEICGLECVSVQFLER